MGGCVGPPAPALWFVCREWLECGGWHLNSAQRRVPAGPAPHLTARFKSQSFRRALKARSSPNNHRLLFQKQPAWSQVTSKRATSSCGQQQHECDGVRLSSVCPHTLLVRAQTRRHLGCSSFLEAECCSTRFTGVAISLWNVPHLKCPQNWNCSRVFLFFNVIKKKSDRLFRPQ